MQWEKTKSTTESYRSLSQKANSQYSNPISRDRPAANLFSTKLSMMKHVIKCGQCGTDEAKMKCLECVENYCVDCCTQFHLRGALQRHRRILLSDNRASLSPKKKQSFNIDFNHREASYRKSNDDLSQKSAMTSYTPESEKYHNEKSNVLSFQQSGLQRRDKSNHIRQNHGPITSINENSFDRADYLYRLPNIEFNSSKRSRLAERRNQLTSIQRSKRTQVSKKNKPKIGVLINIYHSLSDDIDLNEPNSHIEAVNNDLSVTPTQKSLETMPVEENLTDEKNLEQSEEPERPITHISSKSYSRSNSTTMQKDSKSSRPSSIIRLRKSLHNVLTTKSTDELEAIVHGELILSRSSSTTIEKDDQSSTVLSEKSILNEIVDQSNEIDRNSTPPSDLPDEVQHGLASRITHLSESESPMRIDNEQFSTHDFCMNSPTIISSRNSPFSFTNSKHTTNRINSSFSTDTNDDGFFTDIVARLTPPDSHSTNLLSQSNELKSTSKSQSPQQQTKLQSPSKHNASVGRLSRKSSKHSLSLEEKHQRSKSQINTDNRAESSLSSASLPVSVASSKSTFMNPNAGSTSSTASRKNSSSSRKSSSTSILTTKSPSPTISTERKASTTTLKSNKEPSILDGHQSLHESTDQFKGQSLTNINIHEALNDSLKPISVTNSTEDENVTKNNSQHKQKSRHRQIKHSNESSKCRKLGFSMGDGLKWQEASMESFSSVKTTASEHSLYTANDRSLTPSNPINTQFSQQFSKYDDDDGRLSRADQNRNDENCFSQLREELCSTLAMNSSDEDAILNEYLLTILRDVQLPSNDNDTLKTN